MFDREGFIEYVGNKNGKSYARGLSKIEKMYSVGLDDEYAKDLCQTLLAQIESDKQRPGIEEKEQGAYKAAARNLKRYLYFRINAHDTITDRIHFVIDYYKSHFEKADEGERYKWEAIAWYQKHWKIDAPNFAEMLEIAFSKADNLLAAGKYYPYKMILSYAKDNPEEVRRIFKVLYSEQLPFAVRYRTFRDSCDKWVASLNGEKKLNHYQDLHAIMVYLSFEHPEKYYFFKASMYDSFRERIGFHEEELEKLSIINDLSNYNRMCELVLEEARKDDDLIAMHKARLGSDCYSDTALHILTMDIVFYGANYMTDKDFYIRQVRLRNAEYWPSLDEYDPSITVEMWLTALRDQTVTSPENLDMLQKIREQGGESTCAHLAEIYGNTANYYVGLANGFAGKVKKFFDCPDCIEYEGDTDERSIVYVVPFIGRYVVENGNRRYSWRLREELKEALAQMDIPGKSATDIGLNTILYGPPGTGKTYHTVIYAVAIIENRKLSDVEAEDYEKILERYNAYKAQGRIEFTTFHQSYGYEEFIEGIKPAPAEEDADGKSGDVLYSVQSGVFKRFCEKAERPATVTAADLGIGESPAIWKVSLESAGDNPTRTECLKNDHIRIGWDNYGMDITDETDFSVSGGRVVLNAFINKMRIGDLVLSCYSASTIDAIGVVTGEYEWHDEYPSLKRLRKVKWIVKGIRENILAINGGVSMTLSSVYRLSISLSDVYQIIEKYQPKQAASAKDDNYVFIIDEINRGNISKIFGELITLIEPSKRMGRKEELTVRLPYSQKLFGVPKNVYIISTMNTADRSIAAIDTALRRRFQFREMLPNTDVLAGITVEGLNIGDMLSRMNQRITVLYDREHTIGHAYFLPLRDNPTVQKLGEIFADSIIPLLQEYFYEDYEKIRLVLGDNQKTDSEKQFVVAKSVNYAKLFGNAEIDLDETSSFEINNGAFYRLESYQSI